MSSCSQCGKQRKALKRCSRCKKASYCGAACQNAAWKGHKKSCVTLEEVMERVDAAHDRQDWRAVLEWEGRMDDMMENQTDAGCNNIIEVFSGAHREAFDSTGSAANSLSIVRLETRHIEVLGKMQRFRDQGRAFVAVADHLLGFGRRQEAEGYFERARKIAEAHGFFSVECLSCLGLGKLAMAEWRDEEGVDLLRNALVCVPLCEEENTSMELNVLHFFLTALFHTQAIDEAEPLVARYREVATENSGTEGRLTFAVCHSLYMSAQLHEVLCTCIPRPLHTALPLHFAKADSVSHRYHHARIKKHAPVEPHALARHARDLERPRRRCALCSTSCAGTRHQCEPSPFNLDTCWVKRASASRCSTQNMGRRSSSRPWQPSWPSFCCLSGNQVRWCLVSQPHRPPHPPYRFRDRR